MRKVFPYNLKLNFQAGYLSAAVVNFRETTRCFSQLKLKFVFILIKRLLCDRRIGIET
ncbi:hypothetical protein CBL_11936 [Carabus blaptoides fortunei]